MSTPLAKKFLIVGTCSLGIGSMILLRKKMQGNANIDNINISHLPINSIKEALEWRPPARSDLLKKAQDEHFDLLVVGGGATGTGVALDATTRGLKVLLVERGDFSSGTSSKSTKLIHGGVRYLEKAFKTLDFAQFALVKDALTERSIILSICPHLTSSLPIMLPIRCKDKESNISFIMNSWKVPYYWMGAKMYDLFAGSKGLEPSYFLNKQKTIKEFPLLKEEGLFGSVIYHDGTQNDSRTNVALALTSVYHGATSLNYCQLMSFTKGINGKINGAIIKDMIGEGKEIKVSFDQVVNATGPFSDSIRKMANPLLKDIISPSTGVHVILPSKMSPKSMGILDPMTNDGRVLFLLPWEGKTVAGTTDEFCTALPLESSPIPSEGEIDWIIKESQGLLKENSLERKDILSAWSGIRPLVKNSSESGRSESLIRDHLVERDPISNLITIAGGKWTTYRKMSSDTVDEVILGTTKDFKKCMTDKIMLIGSHAFVNKEEGINKLRNVYGMSSELADHLTSNYGDRAPLVASIAYGERESNRKRLDERYPFLEGEVRYSIRCEYACTATDILSRRMRLAQLDVSAADKCLKRVLEIMAEESNGVNLPKWTKKEYKRQLEEAKHYLVSCGSMVVNGSENENENCRNNQKGGDDMISKIDNDRIKNLSSLYRKYSLHQWKRLSLERASELLDDCNGELSNSLDPKKIGSVSFEDFIISDKLKKIIGMNIRDDGMLYDSKQQEQQQQSIINDKREKTNF